MSKISGGLGSWSARLSGAIERHGAWGAVRRAAGYGAMSLRGPARRWSNQASKSLHFAKLRTTNRVERLRARAASPSPLYLVVNIDTEGPSSIDKNRDWAAVEAEVRAVLDPGFRAPERWNLARPLVLSWFVVDWVGADHSRRDRALGYHAVFDRYRSWLTSEGRDSGDELYWHYHHVHPGDVESSNRNWLDFPEYERILSRRLLERGYFPSCYRAGNTWEDAEVSRWLERWIPYDLSNRAP